MLCHLVDNNSIVANILSTHVKISLQKWDSSELYLNNVR